MAQSQKNDITSDPSGDCLMLGYLKQSTETIVHSIRDPQKNHMSIEMKTHILRIPEKNLYPSELKGEILMFSRPIKTDLYFLLCA